ncbi:MAG TPA: non-ribosomal peptide synthetase [Pyrinomonadaceae bacterium]|nr:non-ribosomal peptide synthetase [Pyrinomonadaceae bacterium]
MTIQEDINGSITHAFERQVDLHATRPAIHTSAHSLTYKQVDALANRVANELFARRDNSSEPIPVIINDPALMLSAALGVLKAGKFYVPVNPHFPAARVQLLVEDVNPALIICDEIGRAALNATPCHQTSIQIEELLSNGADERPDTPVDPERFAYILYTSGSTGRPKGVMQTHRNVLHNIFRHNGLGVCPDDRVTLMTADGFTAAVSNPFLALLNGASLASYSFRDDGVDGALEWIKDRRITIYYSFPSFFRQIAATAASESDSQRDQTLRLLYFGGEQVFPSDVEAARTLFPSATISIGLNSTETGLTRLLLLSPEDEVSKHVLPVGGPVKGADLKIVDHAGVELRNGVPGEIAVISPYIFPRYWHQQNGTSPGDALDTGEPRMFRTGDRGYITPKGELVFLGRTDSMVKVRGYRVELSEVESSLNGLPAVKEAAVIPYPATPEEIELIAYVAAKDPHTDGRTIRRLLAESLPEPMLPSRIIFVDTLPRTSNGKVDRRALPSPEPVSSSAEEHYIAPQNAFEEGVARIWSHALSAEKIGVSDNFFEMGGHSVMAVRVVSAIRKEFNVALRLQTIFTTPTIKALAEEIVRLRANQGLAEEVGKK